MLIFVTALCRGKALSGTSRTEVSGVCVNISMRAYRGTLRLCGATMVSWVVSRHAVGLAAQVVSCWWVCYRHLLSEDLEALLEGGRDCLSLSKTRYAPERRAQHASPT